MVTKGMDDFTVEYSDQAKARMEDPECAEAVRETMAELRQALCEVDMEDADAVAAVMEQFGATRVDPEELEEDDDGDDEEGDSDFRA
jgi:hypothetical protein